MSIFRPRLPDYSAKFAELCLSIALIRLMYGEVSGAQEIADDLRGMTGVFGAPFVAEIIDMHIAARGATGRQQAA